MQKPRSFRKFKFISNSSASNNARKIQKYFYLLAIKKDSIYYNPTITPGAVNFHKCELLPYKQNILVQNHTFLLCRSDGMVNIVACSYSRLA